MIVSKQQEAYDEVRMYAKGNGVTLNSMLGKLLETNRALNNHLKNAINFEFKVQSRMVS